jgi:hypothetical protein
MWHDLLAVTMSRFVWYNLSSRVVTTSRFAFRLPVGRDFSQGLLSMLSIKSGIGLYPVEIMEMGEGVDRKKRL